MGNVEIIDFNLPLGTNKSIIITKVPWNKSSEELKFMLERRYQTFGLIHSIIIVKKSTNSVSKSEGKLNQMKRQDENHSPDSTFMNQNCERSTIYFTAFINFYSSISTREARLKTNGSRIIRNSKPFCVMVKRSKGFTKPRRLNYKESVELANYYFGFNGWSYYILYHSPEKMLPHSENETQESTTTLEENKLLWVSVVRVVVGNLTVEGVSKEIIDLDVDISQKGVEFRRAQTQAYKMALVNALGKLLIVIIEKESKKIKVVVDTNVKDPFFYDPLWETTNLELTKFSCTESNDEPGRSLNKDHSPTMQDKISKLPEVNQFRR